jgi:hypothetical protein
MQQVMDRRLKSKEAIISFSSNLRCPSGECSFIYIFIYLFCLVLICDRRLIPFLFPALLLCGPGDCKAVGDVLRSIVVPLLVRLKGSSLLSSKLVFSVFPPGHTREGFLLNFSKVTELDDAFDEFVTK